MNRKQGTLLNFLRTNSTIQVQNNDEETHRPAKKQKPAAVRPYNQEYLNYGFILWPKSMEEDLRPMSIICHEVLVNDAMKPSKM